MKTIAYLVAFVAFLALAAAFAPQVEAAVRHVTKTVVRTEGVSHARARRYERYERSYSSDCNASSYSSYGSNCAGLSSSDCDLSGMRSSNCNGVSGPSRRRSNAVQVIIR